MKRTLLASAAILAFWTPTLAADLPTKAPAVVPVAAYSWTGFYFGANLGGGWASATTSDRFFVGPNGTGRAGPAVSFSNNLNGLIGGGQIGYNWQTGMWVLGAEADLDGSNQNATSCVHPAVTPAITTDCVNARVRSFGTMRGRLGIAVDRWMVYGTGGFGWQNISASETFNAPIFGTAFVRGANISTTRSGLAAGGGFEVALWDKWTVGAEYLYLSAGTWNPAIANFAATGPSVVESNRGRNNIVRARLNYRFW